MLTASSVSALSCLAATLFVSVRAFPAIGDLVDLHASSTEFSPVTFDPNDISSGGLSRRTLPPGALWGDNDVPNMLDIQQTGIQGCGLMSALIALLYVDQKWITNLITYTGDPKSNTAATVNLFDSRSLAPSPKLILKSNLPEGRYDAQEGWWVGAVEQAVRDSVTSISLFPATALQLLTGRPSKVYYAETVFPGRDGSIGKERAWEIINTAPREPLIIQSLPWGTKHIWPGHAWALIGGHGGVVAGEKRWVTIQNPRGQRETWDLDVVWPDCYLIHALANGADEKPASEPPTPLSGDVPVRFAQAE